MLDFLYADHERVASLLAQLNARGIPTSFEETGSKTKQTNKTGKAGFGILEGQLGGNREWRKEVRLTYDPLWSNSQKLIAYIDENSNFERNSKLDIGQIRIFTGKLIAYDLSSLTNIMNAGAMDDFIASGITDDENEANRSSKVRRESKKKEAEVIRHFIKGLSLGVGFVLVTDIAHFWFSVKRDYLSLYDLDVPLKFPIHISGDWNVLGVVDALAKDHVDGIQDIINKNIDGLIPMMVMHMMQLTGVTTAMFGRPLLANGLSPLVAYRRVTI